MLKQAKSPDGYKYLLAYRKSEELLTGTLDYTATFPKDKTGIGLADQMDRSARSTKQNTVEGWKRNATHEYYTFLGYAVASNAELLEDYLDICLGRYERKGINGVKGGKGENAEAVNPISPIVPISPIGQKGEKGERGKTGEKGERELKNWLEKLRFYPLDATLPIPVQLYLRCKEMNFLLEKLQSSLLARMQEHQTLSETDRRRLVVLKIQKKEAESEAWYKGELDRLGLVMTPQGMKRKAEMGERGRNAKIEPTPISP